MSCRPGGHLSATAPSLHLQSVWLQITRKDSELNLFQMYFLKQSNHLLMSLWVKNRLVKMTKTKWALWKPSATAGADDSAAFIFLNEEAAEVGIQAFILKSTSGELQSNTSADMLTCFGTKPWRIFQLNEKSNKTTTKSQFTQILHLNFWVRYLKNILLNDFFLFASLNDSGDEKASFFNHHHHSINSLCSSSSSGKDDYGL